MSSVGLLRHSRPGLSLYGISRPTMQDCLLHTQICMSDVCADDGMGSESSLGPHLILDALLKGTREQQ